MELVMPTRVMRPLAALLIVVGGTLAVGSTADASATCSRTGITRSSAGNREVCVLIAGRRYWVTDPRFSTTASPSVSVVARIRPGGELSNLDLRGIDLTGRDLSTARISRANLQGVRLSSAFIMSVNFASANLAQADLSGTNGGWVYFNGANLEGANLTGARLRGSNFDAYVDNFTIRVNLRGARLDMADLSWSTFENADFTGASARGATFSGANFQQARVLGADLAGANFQGADLSDANFTGSKVGPDWRSSFSGARFENTTWVDGSVWSSVPSSP